MRPLFFALSALLMLTFTGCSGGVKDAPTTIPVTGTVTFDSQPVADATVVFNPKADGKVATGITNANGEYTLKTAGTDGAVAGEYIVSISPTGEVPMPGTAEAEKYDPNTVLPAKYADPTTSGLSASVSSGSSKFDFALSKE